MRGSQVVTGERVTTPTGGFNPTWQRHVAAYELCKDFLPPGRVLDLGCGVGHSWRTLEPRETVGVDLDSDALRGQARETVVADMRDLPFDNHAFASVLAVHSLEHVPDPERALAEARRVLEPGGVAVFVTPNRLTFARADEIIDPYHFIEFSPRELGAACEAHFEHVALHGLGGSERYLDIMADQKRRLDSLLSKDPLRARRLVPRRFRQRLYDALLTRARRDPSPEELAITPADFQLGDADDACLDVVAVCSR